MCGNPEDAEEVAQDTLINAFQHFDSLREPERVRSWVFRIAKNACLMQRRRSVFAPVRELPVDELAPGDEPLGEDAPPDAAFLNSELKTVIFRMIADLPPLYRQVILLRDVEELSTEEAAQILEVSQDVVKTRLRRGRLALRQRLDCYVNNRCVEDEPLPDPSPLRAEERQRLYVEWRAALNERTRPEAPFSPAGGKTP